VAIIQGVIPTTNAFKRCSTCKDPIGFETRYYLCSVSTCNRKRMTLVFCSVACWDAHQADARHRDAGAEEARSPTAAEWAREQALEKEKVSTKNEGGGAVQMHRVTGAASLDILVIAAKLKDYIRLRAGMSMADRALGLLSDHLRQLCDQAISAAGRDGRRTIMDRDVTPLITRGLESLATGAGDPDDRVDDVLIVTSKLKAYVKARAGMNTSDSVPLVLSSHVRSLARQAIRYAGTDDRKTVLDRDFSRALSRGAT
jgi:histone H3/H4